MLVKLSPWIVLLFLEYSDKLDEVPTKNNMAISFSINIQYLYGTKLMLDKTDW